MYFGQRITLSKKKQRSSRYFGLQDTFFTANTLNSDSKRSVSSTNHALYGELTLPITPDLALTTGLRHSRETQNYAAHWVANPLNPSAIREARDNQQLTDTYTTGRIGLNYDISQHTNLYAIYSNGYQTGGFSDISTNIAKGLPDRPYKPSQVNAYELGIKYFSTAHNLGIRTAVFLNNNQNNKLFSFNAGNGTTDAENFDTQSSGVELAVDWQATKRLHLNTNITYTDARITALPSASLTRTKVGNHIPDTPHWSSSIALDYRVPVHFDSQLFDEMSLRVNHRYTGKRAADVENNYDLKSHHITDLRLTLQGNN